MQLQRRCGLAFCYCFGLGFYLLVAKFSGRLRNMCRCRYDHGLLCALVVTMSKPVFKKLPAPCMAYVMPLLLSIIMSCIVSLISTLKSTGFADFELRLWCGAWFLSWVVAYPVLLLILPLVRKLSSFIVESPTGH